MRLRTKPVLCNYYVTYRCNAKCGFCDIWERPSPYVTEKEVEENMKALKKLGVKVVDFTGGEPLLHRDLDKLLGIAKKYGMITTVTTNAMLYPKYAERLKGKIDMLHFSLDAATAEDHDTSRGVKCFDLVQQSVGKAKALGEKVDILYTVTPENIGDIQQVYEEFCLPNKWLLILNPVFDYNEVGENNFDKEAFSELRRWAKKPWVYLNGGFLKLREDGGNHIDDPICKAASTTLVISPQNELVLPCYHLGTKSFPIQNNLDTLYHSDEVQAVVKQEGKLPECEGCVINCYMQPSFAVEMNKYFWAALPSTIKYNWLKGTWKQLNLS
ncbi:radical SAM protein [Sediminitomix flava]|uniref:MoaA/NifB/PqqE/SkfB family radical SAM enzyme n=1 Tax=Sediminitomix flava TaxID=379075 RepID=A0A315ZDJ7_SEDFL|nr:radical SAM protein [Sediminitomix flava]PWJ43392.1 MoaA/NifB/PqqE/SkfB family radical SAM enzyme [Sediminitomix flava]